jgi:uncharacterized protein with HEPN domain
VIDRNLDRLELILEMIAHVIRRTADTTEAEFLSDRDEVDLTAYRLAVIGETTYKLTDELKSRHPQILWADIYGMRNVIVHDYESIKPERVWDVLGHNLDELAVVCRLELGDEVR